MTGTIVAVNANGKGISGLAPDAVLPLKGLDDAGFGSWSDLADAFDYAGDHGLRVVNACLGAQAYVPVIDDVISAHPNTLYVVSAGNDNADLDVTTYYPCEAPANERPVRRRFRQPRPAGVASPTTARRRGRLRARRQRVLELPEAPALRQAAIAISTAPRWRRRTSRPRPR